MNASNRIMPLALLAASVFILCASGCETRWWRARRIFQVPPPPMTLGTQSDEIWQKQEANAEASAASAVASAVLEVASNRRS